MISKNPKETTEIVRKFLREIIKGNKQKGATIVGLSGDLGAGKTAFAQAAARHLGVKNKVASPTFVIIKKYPLKAKPHKYFFHIDAYRLKNEKELLRLGWEEIAGKEEHLVFVEWPERVRKIIPAGARQVRISAGKNGVRNIKLK